MRAALALMASLMLLQEGPVTTNGIIEGDILRLDNREPLADVELRILNSRFRSDDKGHFIVRDLRPGSYSIALGPATFDYFFPLQGSGDAKVQVQPGEHVRNLQIFLIPGATMSGRLLDQSGRPVSGVRIELQQLVYRYGRPFLGGGVVGLVQTDDHGEYRTFVPPGEYYIASVAGRDVSAYYPGTLDAGRAEPITVKAGESADHLDFLLQPPPGNTILGMLLYPSGADIARLRTSFVVVPTGRLTSTNALSARGTMLPGGEFQIPNLVAGSYEIVVGSSTTVAGTLSQQSSDSPAEVFSGRMSVDVREGEDNQIVIAMHRAADVQGRIVLEGSAPVSMNALSVGWFELDPVPAVNSLLNSRGKPDSDGAFFIRNLPDSRYGVEISGLPEEAFVADVRQGQSSVLDSGIKVEGQGTEPFEVIVKTEGSASLAGVVTDSGNNVVSNTRVLLVSRSGRRAAAFSTAAKEAVTDAAGRFSMRGVAPGEYTLFAWEKVPPRAWENSEFLQAYEGQGTAMKIEEGSRTIDVPVRFIETTLPGL